MSRVVFKFSLGFLVVALILVAISLFVSAHYMEEQSRLAAAGDLEGAVQSTRLAGRFDPFSSKPALARAFLFQQQGRNQAAADAMEEAVRRDPHNYVTHFLLGNLQLSLNNLDAAVESYREALRLNPHSTVARMVLAEALVRAGKLEEAGQEYEKLRESGNITPKGLYDLGRIYVRTGQPGKGVRIIKAAQRELETELEKSKGPRKAQMLVQIRSMDLAIADGLVVQRRYGQAREVLANSEARQAPAILELLNTDPEGYRESVKNSAIY